jgi:putative ABC transport system permease protein
MKLPRIAAEGTRALAANKLRTFFMMAGTVVGIAALTIIMAIGRGTERKVMKRVQNFGPRAIMLIAGGGKDLPPPDLTVTTLTLEDAEAVRNQIPGIEVVSPAAMKRQASIKAGTAQTQATVFAIEPNWHEAWDWYAARGEEITDQDTALMARVCVLGTTLARDLFGDQDPVGEDVQIGTVRFRVTGVLESRGVSPMGTDFDNRALIPLTTGLRRLFNQDHVTYIRIKVRNAAALEEVGEQVRQLIHQRHHINPPQEDDFRIVTAAVIAELARGTSRTLSILLIALAGLSLLVGGVVLMNILLISVAERTKEIGLRRAVGATRGDIFAQFLTESLAVSLVGMVLGSLLGWGACLILPRVTAMPVAVSWEPFALALAFALLVGTFFGVQPARGAARLHPVEALR